MARVLVEVGVRASGVVLMALPLAVPLAHAFGAHGFARAVDAIWVPFCHRIPDRCPILFGELLPLCSRCLGIVVGFGAGLAAAWPVLTLRRLLQVVAAAAVFLAVELVTQELGYHPVFHPTRLLSGMLLAYPIGAAAGALARSSRAFRRLHRRGDFSCFSQ